MSLGRRPPVESPVPLRGFGAALHTALSPGARRRAELTIDAWLHHRHGCRAAVLTDSGTAALTLALLVAADATGRRRVALPAYGCFDLATACDGAGLGVVLYDVDPATLGPDWTSLGQVVDRQTAAVVAVHLYGIPVDMGRVRSLCESAGALLIEDAAQGVGGSMHGRALGSHGDLAVLSFGRGKGLTAGGGGALLVHAEALVGRVADRARALPGGGAGLERLAASLAQWLLGRPGCYWLPASLPFLGLGETPYHAPRPRSGLSAAGHGLLLGAIAAEPDASARRRQAGERLRAALGANNPSFRLPEPAWGGTPGYLRFPLVAGAALAGRLRGPAAAEEGIVPGYPSALVDLPGFSGRMDGAFGQYSGSRSLAAGLFTLPTHRWARIERIASVVLAP